MKNIILIIIICLSGIVGLFGTTGQEVLDKVEATLTSPKDMKPILRCHSVAPIMTGTGNRGHSASGIWEKISASLSS